jgi:hypothetical protein
MAAFVAAQLGDDAALPFHLVEIEVYRPGVATVGFQGAVIAAPWLALAQTADAVETTERVRAADRGYRQRHDDFGGVLAWPATLVEGGPRLERRLNPAPWHSPVAAGWGEVALVDVDRRYDQLAAATSADGRRVRILEGRKAWDAQRGVWVDPPLADLRELATAVGAGRFQRRDTVVALQLRDAGWYLERPAQAATYGGGGGLDGTAELAGVARPKSRGGTTAAPIRNVTPTLVDPAHRIYQYNDGPGRIIALYERGAATITFQGDAADLYAGSTASGQYRTDDARGLFQLGATPVGLITCDVVGHFPVAGHKTVAADIARWLITEDIGVPAEWVETGGFASLAVTMPYVSGLHLAAGADAVDAVGVVLAGINARLIATATGQLTAIRLRPPGTVQIRRSYGRAEIVDVTPRALPDGMDPPPWRLSLGHARNHTVQTSDLNATVTAARRQDLALDQRLARWSDVANQVAWRRAGDLGPVPTALLVQADAEAVVAEIGAVIGARRQLLDLTLPVAFATAQDLGDEVAVTWPGMGLELGRPAVVVGVAIEVGREVFVLTVLI